MAKLAILFTVPASRVEAAGYLSGYEEIEPVSAGVSWWSTLAYVISLIAVFAIVLVMAYVFARLIGGKLNARMSGQTSKVLENLPLGPNRSVCIVEMAGRVFLLGVTDSSINLLTEITDEEEIERLRAAAREISSDVFRQEFGTLSSIMDRLTSKKKH